MVVTFIALKIYNSDLYILPHLSLTAQLWVVAIDTVTHFIDKETEAQVKQHA